jgi:hypothetical protein
VAAARPPISPPSQRTRGVCRDTRSPQQ